MSAKNYRHIYGPVPSRRLGRSLGVDLVPFKTCTYDCVYCQLGRTTNKTIERKEYITLSEVTAELKRKLAAGGEKPEYIGIAGSGEPTLHSGIGDLIREIKAMTDIPVAVVTNGSLLWMSEVQDDLMAADLVLPSLDAGDEELFRYVNRPHKELSFDRMVAGLAEFTERFPGEVWLEVFLLGGVTGLPVEAKKIASIIERIRPARVQLNTVMRPPAEEYAFALSPERLRALKSLFPSVVDIVHEPGAGHSHTPVASDTDDKEILDLLGRRPCTCADVAAGLGMHAAEALKQLEALFAAGRISRIVAEGRYFYACRKSESAGQNLDGLKKRME